MRRYHLMGTCHVDLTWHGDENQYADYMEQFTVILVDMLEQYPDMTRFHELQERAKAEGNEAIFSLPRDFFDDMRSYQQDYSVENADLNPEFTGTYSNRVEIRRANRRAETALIDAEKWLALSGKTTNLDISWWEMNYVHFHDVFTGSVPDSSSSQHGEHNFFFALLPYAGKWEDSGVLTAGQRFNDPLRICGAQEGVQPMESCLSMDNQNIVLSCVKPVAEHAAIFRVTESIGQAESCTVTIPGAVRAYASNMLEQKLEEIPVENGVIALDFQPWQIRTVYVEKE